MTITFVTSIASILTSNPMFFNVVEVLGAITIRLTSIFGHIEVNSLASILVPTT
jgi:hypothetical protein